MLYAISGIDVPNSLANRVESRSAHLARITELQDQGRLVLAGPHPIPDTPDPGQAGFSGSLIVAEFPSLIEAEAWARLDPYVDSGVWREVIVKPFVQVRP